ncbi:MAG: T9SS type A sorting domain-containing protein [Flavobacteriales bacterium]
MKTILLLIALCLLNFKLVYGQNNFSWPDSNVSWKKSGQLNGYPGSGNNEDIHFEIYTYAAGDTIVDSVEYVIYVNKKFSRRYHYGTSNPINQGHISSNQILLREAQKKVFYYDMDSLTERMLYDFSLDVGDSIAVFDGNSDSYRYKKIEEVDSILIGNQWRKRQRINAPDGYCYHDHIYFIEGIGSHIGVKYDEITAGLSGCSVQLNCFTHNDTTFVIDGSGGYNTIDGSCLIQNISTHELVEPQLDLFFDQSNQTLHYNSTQYNPVHFIYVFDVWGRMALRFNNLDHSNEINLKALPTGVYLLQVNFKNKSTISTKVLIH